MFNYNINMQYFQAALYGICMVIAVGLNHHLKDKDIKIRRIPQIIIGGLIIGFEILKQIICIKGNSGGQNIFAFIQNDFTEDHYDTYALPFHFCSFFFFWQVFSIFSKGKLKGFFESMAFLWSVMIAIFMFTMPDTIYGGAVDDFAEGNLPYFPHTLLFHALAIMYFFNECALHISEFKKEHFYHAMIGFAIFAAFAIPAGFIFKENYCSVLRCDLPLPFLEDIRVNNGQLLYEILLCILGCSLMTIVYLAIYGIRKLEKHLNGNIFIELGALIWGIVLFPVINSINPKNIIPQLFFPLILGMLIVLVLPGILISVLKKNK